MNYSIKDKLVFLPVEVKNREWKSQLLLTHYFLRQGYTVVVGVLWNLREHVLHDSCNSIYIGKDFYKYEKETLLKIKQHNNFIVGWDAEGLIYDKDENYCALQLNEDVLNLHDIIITWGDRQKKTIGEFIKNYSNIKSLGNPRVDLLRDEVVAKVNSNEFDYINSRYKNYILINSNFNLSTRNDYNFKRAVIDTNGFNPDKNSFLDDYQNYSENLFPLFVSMIKTVARNNPDKTIILRPHPAERSSDWERILEDFDNIYIEKKFSVNPWIYNAKLVIHSGCTTGIESVLMGKATFSYMPKLNVKYIDTFPDKISKAVHTEDEMLSCINDCFSDAYKNELDSTQEKLINYYFSLDKNKTCSERIVEEIDKQYRGCGTFSFNNSLLKRVIKKIINKQQKDLNVEFGHVTLEECIRDFKSIYDSLDGKYKYKIKEIGENEFVLINKNHLRNISINWKKSLKDELAFFNPIRLFRDVKKRMRKQKFVKQVIHTLNTKETKSLLHIMKGSEKDYTNILKKNLARVLRKAYKKVPYWHNFSQLKTANKRNCLDVLSALPVLSKEIIRAEGNNMWQKGCSPDNSITGSTGGTTGSPLLFLRSYAKEDTHQPALYEYMTGLSYEKHLTGFGRIVGFGGTRPSEDKLKKHIFWTENFNSDIYDSVTFCSFYMTDENIKYYIARLNELQPYVIRGYSNAILSMAKFIEKYGRLSFCPKGIYVTSEYCSKESMLYISKAFGCNVYGQYGQNEACLFAWTKPNDDTYYCSPYYGYVEILDENGKHVKEGEVGEVTVTAFFKSYQQPFIRYKTGDLVKYGGTKKGIVCLSELIGRNNDYIVDSEGDKIMLSGYLDIHYFHCKDKINSYQIVQNEKGRVIFKIVKTADWKDSDEEEIRQLLAVRNIKVDFEYPLEIPLTAKGKRKNIVQNIIV